MSQENLNQNNTGATKLCKYCQTEIPKKAVICPNCKKKQTGCLGCFVYIIIIFIVIGVIASIGGKSDKDKAKKVGNVTTTENVSAANAKSDDGNSDDTSVANDKSDDGSSDDTSADDGSSSASDDNTFAVGDIVDTGDLKISYISAEEYSFDNQFEQPKDGNVFYRMEFEVENTSDSDQYVSSMSGWECYADGYATDQIWYGDDDLSATLSSGRKCKGALYFEVPADATEIALEYKSNVFLDDKVIFTVK